MVSELPPGAQAHRWCFVARNRIIAALGAATVVVQATERSGSLTTADFAAELGRAVGAVPGPVTSRLSAGTHGLIQAGAPLIRDAADALELLAGATGRVFDAPAPQPPDPAARRCSTARGRRGSLRAATSRSGARAGARARARPHDAPGASARARVAAPGLRRAASGLGARVRRRASRGRWERAA